VEGDPKGCWQQMIVSTSEFWDLMCDPRAIRTSRLAIRLAGKDYVTLEAPEDVSGFIECKINSAISALYPPSKGSAYGTPLTYPF
jgi:hypothetical protein